MTSGNSTPEYHSATILLHMWDTVLEAFDITGLSSNTSAIIRIQIDPNFVRKQHPTSLVGRPFCMIPCPSVTESMVLWCTTWCSPWSSGMQIHIMQSFPNSLMQHVMSCSLFECRIQIWSTQPTVPSTQKSHINHPVHLSKMEGLCGVSPQHCP